MPEIDSRFAIAIQAKDQTGAVTNQVRDRFGKLGKDVERHALGPLGRMRRELGGAARDIRDVANEGRDAFRSLGESLKPLAVLTAFGSLAGVGEQLSAFANAGAAAGRTAQNLGISAQSLEAFRGGAYLAGSSADALTQSLDGVQQSLHAAAYGDAEAIGAYRMLGINFRELATGEIPAADKALAQIADRIARMREPWLQSFYAARLGISRDLLPYLRRGAAGIAELNQEAERNGLVMSDSARKIAEEWEKSERNLEGAVLGLRNAIAVQLATAFEPSLRSMREWLIKVRETPEAMSAITTGVEALSAVLGVTLVGALGKAVVAMNAWWATPALRFLLMTPLGRAIGIGAVGGKMLYEHGKETGVIDEINKAGGFAQWYEQEEAKLRASSAAPYSKGSMDRPASAPARSPVSDAGQWWARALTSYATGTLGLDSPHAQAMVANAMAESSFNPRAVGKAGELGLFQWLGRRQHEMVNTLGADRYDPWAQLRYAVGEARRTMPDWFNQSGDVRGLTASFERRFENPAQRTGRAQYADEVAAAIEGARDVPAPGYDDAVGRNDSRHEVVVEFRNAPPGLRPYVSKDEGPASFELRTHTALSGP